jgi:very-short-patch-repair endonuclease
MAAVLACGPDALLSHRSAAALWNLAPTSSPLVDVTAPRGRGTHRGIALHRPRKVHPDDRAEHDGIPATSVARTLFDLAEVVDRRRLERAFERAERLGALDMPAIEVVCGRNPGRRAHKALGELLPSLYPDDLGTRSELERRFVDLCRQAGLPAPEVNAFIEGFEVDALWRDQRLVVELDGYEYHRTRAAFERDRARDAALQLAGYRVLRVTARQLAERPAEVVETVRRLLVAA